MHRALPLLTALAALAAAPATASASARQDVPLPALGISDQKPSTFSDPRFRALGLPLARLVVPWDAIFEDPARVDRWLGAARRARVRPLIAFSAGSGQRCPKDPCIPPRPAELLAAFDAFRAAYPWVTDFTAWNEANHESQPTKLRPQVAARYWDALAGACPACTIVAADVLGDKSMLGWLRRFRAAADREPRLWGLHNYSDVNDGHARATRALLRAVPGEVWFTETGGIVRFTTRDGRVARPYDEERAGRAVHAALDLGKLHAERVRRIYLYNWQAGPDGERFDSGMVSFTGEARSALRSLWRRVKGAEPFPPARRATTAARLGLRHAPAAARVLGRSVRKPRGRTVRVRVRCRATQRRCLGLVALSTERLGRVGVGAFAAAGGTDTEVVVTLSRAAAAALPRQAAGTVVGTTLRLRSASGAVAQAVTTLRLRGR